MALFWADIESVWRRQQLILLLLLFSVLLLLLLHTVVDADAVFVDCSGCPEIPDGVEAGVTSLLIGFDIVASQRCTSSVGQANRLRQQPH